MKQFKKDFILTIALSDSHGSAFRRANVYCKDSSEIERDKFIRVFRQKLKNVEPKYVETISEDEHIGNILQFRNELTLDFSHVFANKTMRLGVAQKAVNCESACKYDPALDRNLL